MAYSSVHRCGSVLVAITMVTTQTLPAAQTTQPAPQTKPTTQTKPVTQTKPAPPTTTAPAVPITPTAATQVLEPEWPRYYLTPSQGAVVVHQPQVASWKDQKALVAYAAVSYQSKSSAATAKPALGTITLEAKTSVSLEERLVRFVDLRITDAHFATLPKQQLQEVVKEISDSIPDEERIIALDRVLANIDKSTIIPRDVPGLKADPPTIFYSHRPALMVNFDGDPIWSPIEKNELRFAVNTNWDVFEHPPTKTFYLRDEQNWLQATDIKGPWTAATTLPPSFKTLPSDDNFKEVKANIPGKPIPKGHEPTVFVSTTPAELILVDGAAKYVPVTGTNLQWLSNTESDVFRMGATGGVYYLVAGRWFGAPGLSGPWTFATPTLPEDFKRIPLEHERSRVLASVPNTEQAIEAVMLAQVPQTARVSKSKTQPEPVAYQGQAQFQTIDTTAVQRAVNTDRDVFLVSGVYYYCYQGVWFSGSSANGPWSVATTVPAEIYKIPASSPSHHVTYVTVEEDDDDDDDWVAYAALAGYTGMMIGWGCAVWGSGWYYPPYIYYGGMYPAYYGGFHTYGYSAWYNPWSGAYGRSAVAYGPYGGAGVGARYNPRTGTYARGAAAWGPYGARGYAEAYNPRTGAYGSTRQGSSVYGSWGSTTVQRGDDWAQTRRVTNNRTGTTTRVTRTDDGAAISRRNPGQGGGFVAGSQGGDVYAGRDGNVYRRQDGSWQRYENGSWGNVDRPEGQVGDRAAGAGTGNRGTGAGTTGTGNRGAGTGTNRSVEPSTYGQLERDRTSRTTGTQRTRDYGSVRSGGGTSRPMGSYRGGGMRSGGGRRR